MTTMFPCVQLEFARPLGPSEGRYTIGSDTAATDVFDVRGITAHISPDASRRRRDRSEASALTLVRYTLIRAGSPLVDEHSTRVWLASMRNDAGARRREVGRAVDVLGTAIRAYRVAAADPYASDVSQADALAIRIGAATPRQAFDLNGIDWLSVPRCAKNGGGNAVDQLGCSRAVAAALSGRQRPHAAEDMVLRALVEIGTNPKTGAALLLAAHELITADAEALIDRELLERARVVARVVLARVVPGTAVGETLRAIAVELRQQLRIATEQRIDASASGPIIDSEPVLVEASS
jgi:hypothetical protein